MVPGSGDGRPAGVFLDWACLFQVPRSEEETRVFKNVLACINIGCAHQKTTTIMPTHLPPGATRANYNGSGWPCFERSVAGLISGESHL